MKQPFWRAQTAPKPRPDIFECHSTNCRHKAQQFIQFWHKNDLDKNATFVIGYCKKHAKSELYIAQRWGNSGWVFSKFMDRNEVLVNEIMKS